MGWQNCVRASGVMTVTEDQGPERHDQQLAERLRDLRGESIEWVDPPVGLWDRISDGVREAGSGDRLSATVDSRITTPTEDGDPSPTPQDERGPDRGPGAPRLSRRGLVLAAAGGLVAGVAIGAVGVGAVLRQNDRTIYQAELRSLTDRKLMGEANVVEVGQELFLRITTDEALTAGAGLVEVWLIHRDGRRMISMGVFQGGPREQFPVPRSALEQGFVLVDMSREPLDDDNNHSGDTIMRGELG